MSDDAPRCPGNELNKTLSTIDVKCASCGTMNEIFADEANKAHKCTNCGAALEIPK